MSHFIYVIYFNFKLFKFYLIHVTLVPRLNNRNKLKVKRKVTNCKKIIFSFAKNKFLNFLICFKNINEKFN